jgi:signal transduction histidine kinase
MQSRSGILTWVLFLPLLAGSFYSLLAEQGRPMESSSLPNSGRPVLVLVNAAGVMLALLIVHYARKITENADRQRSGEPGAQIVLSQADARYENLKVELRKKDDFLSIASHELKTPLTSLKIYTQALEQLVQKRGDAEYKPYLEKIDTHTDRLSHLVINLLDVARIEDRKITYIKAPFDLNALVRSAAEDAGALSSKHHISIHGSISRDVYGDEERITQVVANLLSNAIKYSPDSDAVDILLFEADGKAVTGIKDYGIGIAPEYHSKIFERFFRVDGESQGEFPGMGVGLYISAQIISQHDGRMWVKSEKNEGSILFFSLPFAKAASQ